jgi:hypothetical protein
LNGDCFIDLNDFVIFAQNWLRCGNPFDPACGFGWAENFDDGDISDWAVDNPYPTGIFPIILAPSTEHAVSPDFSLKVSGSDYQGGRAAGPDVSIDLSKPYTISFWFRYHDFHWFHMCLFGPVMLTADHTDDKLLYKDASDWHDIGSVHFDSFCPADTWTHWMVEVDPANTRYEVYVNDGLVGTVNYGAFDTGQRGFYLHDVSNGSRTDSIYYDDITILGIP